MAWDRPSENNGSNGNRRPNDSWGEGESNFPDFLSLLRQFLENLGIGGNSNAGGDGPFWRAALGIFMVGSLVWALFGIYQVDQQERAVVLRFGKFHSLVQPGLQWNPPLIDKIQKINVTKVYSQPYNGLMLTKDENIVDIKITVQYRVADPKNFVLRVRDPITSLQHATESALRHVVGGTVIDRVITLGREQVALEVRDRLQDYLNAYETGLSVFQVNINAADPPQAVKSAFDDVNQALEDEQRYKNEAEAYANEVVPRARGSALRALEEAEAYRQRVIARAEGEANRFRQLLYEYSKAPEVTRNRLYLESVQSVLSNASKVMVDLDEGGNILYLPLDQLRRSDIPETAIPEESELNELRHLLRDVSQQLQSVRSNVRRNAR